MKKMKPFEIYQTNNGKFLAITPVYGLKINGEKLGSQLTKITKFKHYEAGKVSLKINLGTTNRQEKELKLNLLIAEDHFNSYKKTKNKKFRKLFFEAVFSACSYFNPAEGRNYNLRDIGNSIKAVSYQSYYKILANQYRSNLRGRRGVVKHSADATVVKSINNLKNMWTSLYGFSDAVDKSLKTEFGIYALEAKSRGLTLSLLERR